MTPRLSSALLALALLTGCTDETPAPASPSEPVDAPAVALETRADSVAYRAVEASGGFEAWRALPALRFEFGFERDGGRQIAARHYWDKAENRYRVEWLGGGDTTFVGIYDPWPDSAAVYATVGDASERLTGEAAEKASATALQRTINDTYWLLAPLKTFDEGVTRTYVPDSSTATTDVVRLSFDGVGLTPGDQYWLFIDRETGLLDRWTFVLEGNPTPRSFDWTAYQTLAGPSGAVQLSARKTAPGAPFALLTNQLRAPSTVDSTLFTDPKPRL